MVRFERVAWLGWAIGVTNPVWNQSGFSWCRSMTSIMAWPTTQGAAWWSQIRHEEDVVVACCRFCRLVSPGVVFHISFTFADGTFHHPFSNFISDAKATEATEVTTDSRRQKTTTDTGGNRLSVLSDRKDDGKSKVKHCKTLLNQITSLYTTKIAKSRNAVNLVKSMKFIKSLTRWIVVECVTKPCSYSMTSTNSTQILSILSIQCWDVHPIRPNMYNRQNSSQHV